MSKSSAKKGPKTSIELEERLLAPEQNSISKDINSKWLSDLFELDNIKDKHSNKMLDGIGGYEGLQKALRTNLKTGIVATVEDKNWRAGKFGKNDPIVKHQKTLWEMVLQNFEDSTIQILCFAAIASLVLGIASHGLAEGWLEGVSILLAVTIIAAVTSFNNYMKDKQFRKLNEVASRKNINVTRNGQTINMSVYQVLVGDIVQIETGEILSVDGLIFKSNRLETDQSAMTGQSDQIKKLDYSPNSNANSFLISGTSVVEGTGMMLVLTVGTNTYEGILKSKLQQDEDQTPLQQKLAQLADQIGIIGVYSASFTFGALVLHLIYDLITRDDLVTFSYLTLNTLVEYFIIGVSIVVIAVPEGLPLAVTISLAYSVSKMKDQNNLVRFLAACETMGGANNVCTDKTGTLTKNQMTVTRMWSQEKIVDKFQPESKSLQQNTKNMVCLGVCLNSDANPKIKTGGKFEQIGNKTQCALIQMAYNYGFDYRKVRKENTIIGTVPFSSSRKKMSAICKTQKDKYYIFSKGAPEFLLPNCSRYVNKNGEIVPIDNSFNDQLAFIISQFASKSLRTILICYQELKKEEANNSDHQKLENNLIVLGLSGIKDPLKQSIPEAVLNCKKAGIIVRMVTGDNVETATAIAKDAHILPNEYERPEKGKTGYYCVMEGKQFRTLCQGLVQHQEKNSQTVKNIKMFQEITNELRVLARSSPQDKYLLATGLKQLDNVVAMTGDGTNDAPALKKADIGFAMGIAGTQIAKDASGIILLDDNFSSIITAVKFGRNIFDCIRKFLQFQLTVNVVAIFMAFLGAVVIKESPLTPVQMLWVNLIMDTLAALALATEPPSEELLRRMPYSRKQYIITPQMWRGIFCGAVFQIIVLTIILFRGAELFGVPSSIGLKIEDWNEKTGIHLTIFFNVFVFLQVFNFFNARKLKKDEINIFEEINDNYLFIFIVIGIFVCQLFIIQFGGKAFLLVPLSASQNLTCILIGALILVNGFVCKKIIPQACFNNFHIFREQNTVEYYDTDSIFKRMYNTPATERRYSKMKRSGKMTSSGKMKISGKMQPENR